jgi:steroid 5-alpha reductase family enzyme
MAVMRPAGYGRIILVASTGGLHGDAGLSAYAASKGALLAFGRSLAAEGARRGVLTNMLVNLVVTAGTVAVLMLATFAYAMRTRVHAIMDTIWPLGCVLIAAVSFGLSAGSGYGGRRVLVLVLTGILGLRLGAHVFARNRGHGEDKRYASLLRRNTGSLAAFVLRYIY